VQMGVMAQETDAAVMDPSGYMRVDYARVE
jgi:hypothetical protein